MAAHFTRGYHDASASFSTYINEADARSGAEITYGSSDRYDLNSVEHCFTGGTSNKRRKLGTIQASELGLADDDMPKLSQFMNREGAHPLDVHYMRMRDEAAQTMFLQKRVNNLATQRDRVMKVSASALDDVDETMLSGVGLDRANGMISLRANATPRALDMARYTLATQVEPKMNSLTTFASKKASTALKQLRANYLQYEAETSRIMATYASPEMRSGFFGFGTTHNYPSGSGSSQSGASNQPGGALLAGPTVTNNFLHALTGETNNNLKYNAYSQNQPFGGSLLNGYQNNNPRDGKTFYRVTYQEVLDMWINVLQATTLIDSVAQHTGFIRAVGSIVVVPQPFTIMKMSTIFDKGFAAASAEEVTFPEMTSRQKSERRGFSQIGMAIRGTLEALLTVLGRESLALKSVQLAAAMAQTLEAATLIAIIEAARIEERRQERPTQPEAAEAVISRLVDGVKSTWSALSRDPMAYLNMIDRARQTVTQKNIRTQGRTEMLIFNQQSRNIVGKMKENITFESTGQVGLPRYKNDEEVRRGQGIGKIVGVEAPTFEFDRYSRIDYMMEVHQLGEVVKIAWDYCSRWAQQEHDYKYSKMLYKFKHHGGNWTYVSMEQLLLKHGELFNGAGFTDIGKQVLHASDTRDTTVQDFCAAVAREERDGRDAAAFVQKMFCKVQSDAVWPAFCAKFGVANPAVAAGASVEAIRTARLAAFQNAVLWSRADVVHGPNDALFNPTRLQWLVKHDVPVFVNFYIFMPHISYNMGQHIYYAKNNSTPSMIHLVTAPLVAQQSTADFRNYVIVARMDHAPVPLESEAFVRVPSTHPGQYMGGDESEKYWRLHDHKPYYTQITSSMTPASMQQQRQNLQTMFVCADVAGHKLCQQPMMDITGKYSARLNISERSNSESQYKTASWYSGDNGWGWKNLHNADEFDMTTATMGEGAMNTLCFVKDSFEFTPSGSWHHTNGEGHRAGIIMDSRFSSICRGATIDTASVNMEISKAIGMQTIPVMAAPNARY
jgi:hypothetical protein